MSEKVIIPEEIGKLIVEKVGNQNSLKQVWYHENKYFIVISGWRSHGQVTYYISAWFDSKKAIISVDNYFG